MSADEMHKRRCDDQTARYAEPPRAQQQLGRGGSGGGWAGGPFRCADDDQQSIVHLERKR